MSDAKADVSSPGLTGLLKTEPDVVASQIGSYNTLHGEEEGAGDVTARKSNYTTMVNTFYDLATDFYEFGWGQCFHFAIQRRGETLHSAIARHEYYVALRLQLEPGQRVLDVGCGVGGPMRAIARFSDTNVVGINNNAYQIQRGEAHNARAGLSEQCSFLKGDFMNIPVAPASFDAAFAFEATCHAPDNVACYSEVRRTLKPGGRFAGYEWCLTDLYDPENETHRNIKKNIELGNGLPDIRTTKQVDEALVAAGFELIEAKDVAPIDPDDKDSLTWYQPLEGGGLSNVRSSMVGRWVTHTSLGFMEKVGAAPVGAQAVSEMLQAGADSLVEGGRLGIFTPMYFFVARNPQ